MRPELLLFTLLCAGCAGAWTPADVPVDEPYLVLIKSARLPAYTSFLVSQAHHSWLELKRGSEDEWELLEVLSKEAFTEKQVLARHKIPAAMARRPTRWDHDVHLHQVVRGAEAEQMVHRLEALAADYEDATNYRGWPGPNSNTFVERLVREIPGLRYEAHHNAVGKDWAWLRVGISNTGTGVEFETPLFGVQLGLEEGVEVHLLQLTFGVDFWPPALKLPFLPRLGF
jgi:hypothetical protein